VGRGLVGPLGSDVWVGWECGGGPFAGGVRELNGRPLVAGDRTGLAASEVKLFKSLTMNLKKVTRSNVFIQHKYCIAICSLQLTVTIIYYEEIT
jgi:hypothetical protein